MKWKDIFLFTKILKTKNVPSLGHLHYKHTLKKNNFLINIFALFFIEKM